MLKHRRRNTDSVTFIGFHGAQRHLGLGRLLQALLCRVGFSELWRVRQRGLRCRQWGLLRRHRCGLVGHGARSNPSFTATLAVGGLPATRRVLLLSVLVLPTVTLVFVLANVPVGLEKENRALKGTMPANICSLLTQH